MKNIGTRRCSMLVFVVLACFVAPSLYSHTMDSPSNHNILGPALLSRVVDYGLVFGASAGLQFLTASTLAVPNLSWFENNSVGLSAWAMLTMSLPMWIYNTALVASPAGATLGHRIGGVRVVTDSGEPIGLGLSLARSAILFLGWELSHIAMFVPENFAFGEPHPWQYVGLSIGTLYLLSDIVAIVATGGKKSIADLILGTRLVAL